MTTALAALGRPQDALPLYDDVRTQTTSPSVHMQAAYATAMLYTRHFEPEQRDHVLARAWANEAVAIAGILPDPATRAFNSAFNRNGLALIEFHQGNPAAALDLLDDCLASLDREWRRTSTPCTGRCCATTARRSSPPSAGTRTPSPTTRR
jgi:hypothetical protein